MLISCTPDKVGWLFWALWPLETVFQSISQSIFQSPKEREKEERNDKRE